jgi:hypothetical protein
VVAVLVRLAVTVALATLALVETELHHLSVVHLLLMLVEAAVHLITGRLEMLVLEVLVAVALAARQVLTERLELLI